MQADVTYNIHIYHLISGWVVRKRTVYKPETPSGNTWVIIFQIAIYSENKERTIPIPDMGQWDNRFRQAHDYAGWHGFITGWPNFHEADYGDGIVQGTFLLRGGVADWRDVPRSDYGVFDIEDVPAMMRAANDYAVSNGYEAGIPNFHQANYGNGVVYGTFLIKNGNTHFLDAPQHLYPNPWQKGEGKERHEQCNRPCF
jgi:hypothetical protein